MNDNGSMNTNEAQAIICQQFTDYLEANHLRKTPERYEILKTIYDIDGIFTIESLHHKLLHEVKFQVSRATLYNTIELLVQANLLMRHQLPHASHFERIDGKGYRCYQICTQCSSIKEFHNAALDSAAEHLKLPRFSTTYKTVYVYGLCAKCEAAAKRKQKKQHTEKKK